jgi:hypothetical protein
LALSTGKDVLPVLLDRTPLPENLKEFQWVDFRWLVGYLHRFPEFGISVAQAIILGLIFLGLLGIVSSGFLWYRIGPLEWLIIILALPIGIPAYLYYTMLDDKPPQIEYQKEMVERLQREFLRRNLILEPIPYALPPRKFPSVSQTLKNLANKLMVIQKPDRR